MTKFSSKCTHIQIVGLFWGRQQSAIIRKMYQFLQESVTHGKIVVIVEQSWILITAKSAHGVARTNPRRLRHGWFFFWVELPKNLSVCFLVCWASIPSPGGVGCCINLQREWWRKVLTSDLKTCSKRIENLMARKGDGHKPTWIVVGISSQIGRDGHRDLSDVSTYGKIIRNLFGSMKPSGSNLCSDTRTYKYLRVSQRVKTDRDLDWVEKGDFLNIWQ